MAIQTFTLDNGMEVVLEENHTSKVVSFSALVKVGSVNETEKEAGICHVIEHMLFKGTPSRPAGTIAMEVEAAGGDINAYTSLDQTVFYINMAMRYADKGLAILADALMNPLFDQEELEREAEVILEEIRREQDNPSRMAAEYLFQNAYKVHPYGRPIIGYPKTVKSFNHKALMDFYRRWYTPKNMSFVAVGDFDTKKMLQLIQKYFKGFKGKAPPDRAIKSEPKQKSSKLIIKEMNVQSSYLALGFHIPEITDPDVPTLDLLAHILGGTDSSRLEQEVKENKHLAHNIFSCAYTPKHPGLLYVGAMLSENAAHKTISAIKEEIEKLHHDPVTAEELSRAKINLKSNEIYEKETVGGQGGKIASFIGAAGSHEFEKRYYQMMTSVVSEDIKRVAAKYINFDNCTAIMIIPKGSKWSKNKSPLKNELKPSKRKTQMKEITAISKPKRVRLKNGTTLIIRENHNLPIVSICTAAVGGIRRETKRNNGISNMMSKMMLKGTKDRNAIQIATDIEKIAGNIDGFSGRNTCGVKTEFLSEYLREGFSLFSDVLCNPSFESGELKKEKHLTLKAIKDQEDALSSLAFANFLEELFPTHPYGLRSMGTVNSVKGISVGALKKHHREAFRSSNLVISVVGDVNPKEIEDIANEMLCDLPKGKGAAVKRKIDKKPSKSRKRIVTKKDKQQAHIVIGYQGVHFKSKDRYAMTVLNNIFSGQGGRLFRTLRDEMSLAYSVSSLNQEGIDPGYFAVYIGTDPSKSQIAIDAMIEELKKICFEKVSKDELDRAKQYLVGTYELELQRNGSLSNLYTFHQLYDIRFEEIDEYPKRILAVTRDDILRVARKYIDPDVYTLSIIKPK
ncbi:MAG: insulinase family protein [Deltaproteobacteria bacterium]|nr:insulinase family protein [Deltaproteobacteria bacterium]